MTTLVITPLFLVAGTFFPIDQLPEGAAGGRRSSTRCTSSWSWCATPAFGFEATDLLRLAGLVVFALALWRVAVRADVEAADRLDTRSSRAR